MKKNHKTPPRGKGEEKKVRMANASLARGLWPFIRPYSWMLALTLVLVLLATGFDLVMPLMIQKAIDGYILPTSSGTKTFLASLEISSFAEFCLLFLGLILAGFCIDFTQTLFMEYTGQKIILNLRCRLFSHMTALPIAYFDKNPSGRLVARVAGDIENMNEMFTSVLIFIFRDLFLMAGIFMVLFSIHTRLALYLSCIIPVIAICIIFFSRALRIIFRTIRQKISEINHSFSETVTGIKIIQTTTTKARFMARFKLLNKAHFQAAMAQIKIFSIFMPFIGFLGVAATATIIWSGSFLVTDNTLTLGELVAFLTYMKLFFRPLRDLSEKFNLLQNALASAERILTAIQEPGEKKGCPSQNRQLGTITRLKFQDIDLSYVPKVPVLSGVSFSLDRGKALGIVGQTGAGKSSVINLITGFYRPGRGKILFNNKDMAAFGIKEIRSRIALVMQDSILFSGTVRENISPAPEGRKESPNMETQLETALANANCQFLFEKFLGLNTRIRDGGQPLSSGEKQLVCIARAFAFDPDLIIFDEATSYMDSAAEQQVHDAMKRLMKGRLSIIIAHRLSTVKDCDEILVLKNGKVVEAGPHGQLARQNGEYRLLLEKEQI